MVFQISQSETGLKNLVFCKNHIDHQNTFYMINLWPMYPNGRGTALKMPQVSVRV